MSAGNVRSLQVKSLRKIDGQQRVVLENWEAFAMGKEDLGV